MTSFVNRVVKGWNVFRDKKDEPVYDYGPSQYTPASRGGFYRGGGVSRNSIVVPIYNRIGIDVAQMEIKHIQTDEKGRFTGEKDSQLNRCLTLEANLDQDPRGFRQDAIQTLCERGAIAIVATERSLGSPSVGGWDIHSMRIGEILQWYPKHVRVNLYNDDSGMYEEVVLPKNTCAIVINPFYAVMNESNSTLQRLIRKLDLLDVVDEQSGSGKLDIIMQLPFAIKGEVKKQQAEERRMAMEAQLKDSQYGVGYIDSTESITQLNRPAENNLMHQVEYLTGLLYSQLGLTTEIVNGTATEEAMLNYHNRTIEPFLTAIINAMNRSFLSKTAYTQGQRIGFFRDPFRLMPLASIAEIADKFTRNEIASSNDIRMAIGWIPSDDPKAEELRNSNLSAPKEESEPTDAPVEEEGQNE